MRDALSYFARAAVQSLLLAARAGVVLDVHPSNFAVVEGAIFYIDDDIALGEDIPSIGHAILQRVEEYEGASEALDAYLDVVEDQIRAQLKPCERLAA